MNRERLDILMNREIDGENTAAETRELEMALATDPDSRRRYEELKEALGMFIGIEPIEPPAGLRDRILAGAGPVPQEQRRSLRAFLGPVLRPAMAASFAVGLVVGGLVISSLHGLDSTDVGQTELVQGMAGRDRDTLSLAHGVVRRFEDERIGGRAVLRSGPEAIVLTVELEADPGTMVRITYPPGLVCTGFRNRNGRADGLRISGGAVGFRADRSGAYEVSWYRRNQTLAPIRIQIHHEGELVAEHSLATGSVK